MIEKLKIDGLRGFGKPKLLSFAMPDHEKEGSGLTCLVGTNNSGKTTVAEALRAFNSISEPPTFSEGKRNKKAGDRVKLELTERILDSTTVRMIRTVAEGGSSTDVFKNNEEFDFRAYDPTIDPIYVLQSRRFMNQEFSNGMQNRNEYLLGAQGSTSNRSPTLNSFEFRLTRMHKHRDEITPYLSLIFDEEINWTVDQNDNGNFFLKFNLQGASHTIEGLGDGMWSVFTLCDALYDAKTDTTVFIDEPELSLHPSFQKRVADLLITESTNKQIIISTHSPYFISWKSLCNGGKLYRLSKDNEGDCDINEMSSNTIKCLESFLRDYRNPHVLGYEAKEAFFLPDNVILVEGQEDTVMYGRIEEQLQRHFKGTLFGWGVGGAEKMPTFLQLMKDLGYKKVVALFDGNMRETMEQCSNDYPEYHIACISTDDIRDKKPQTTKEMFGIMDKDGHIKEEFKDEMSDLIERVNLYFVK